jgi:hypothetical protein
MQHLHISNKFGNLLLLNRERGTLRKVISIPVCPEYRQHCMSPQGTTGWH